MPSILFYLWLENPHPPPSFPSLFSFFVPVGIFILQTRKRINFSAEVSNLGCSFTVYKFLLGKDRHLKLNLHNVTVYPICNS